MNLRALLPATLAVGLLAGCAGGNDLDLGDNPAREIAKQQGPLVVPPAALRDGRTQ